jgi:quercetin dioxygenase-like cupin family protein
MITGHYTDIPAEKPAMADAQATIRWLIAEKDRAPNFAMRVIEIAKKGERIPLHKHGYEHEIFVFEGVGKALSPQGDRPVRSGDFVFVLPDEEHGFLNTGDEPFRFICVIPVART